MSETKMAGCVVGIDASLTGLAICVANDVDVLLQVEFTSKPAKSLRGRFERYQRLCDQVVAALAPYRGDIDAIGLEGYNFGSQTSSTTLGEFGGQLRAALLRTANVLEVSPSTLKQFAAGKGNAKKLEVVSALSHRYGRQFRTDNEADAFGLAQLMLCAIGAATPATEAQRKAVATVQKLRALEAA